MIHHKAKKEWFHKIRTAKFEHFKTLKSLKHAEVKAIKSEKPIHNIMHNPRPPIKFRPKKKFSPPNQVKFYRPKKRHVNFKMDSRVEGVIARISNSKDKTVDVIEDILMMSLHNQDLYETTRRKTIWSGNRIIKSVEIPSSIGVEGKIKHIKFSSADVALTIETLFLMYKLNGYMVPESEIIQPTRNPAI
jgi:hypothetical protein